MSGYYSQSDYMIHYIATTIALLLVSGGWLVVGGAAALGVRAVKRRQVAGLDPAETTEPGGLKYLLYAVSFLFWPAAAAIGAYLISKPRSAPAGAMCLYILLAYFTLSVVIAVVGMGVVAVVRPEWIMGLQGP
jgi:hypothetical protein